MPATYTPIRYPGGKTKLYPLVDAVIEANGLGGCTYCEAFCGGAGLAVKLLLRGRVSAVVLNDLDPAVFSMWDAIVNRPDELCEFVSDVKLSVGEWERRRETFLAADGPSPELGLAAFYLNRTNRSGILRAGPIGGRGQDGAYGIGARFNRKGLVRKIRAISERADSIELRNMDACDFIDNVLAGRDGLLANFDPPYVVKGPELYKSSYTDEDHAALAKKVAGCEFPWIVTYDDDPMVDELYARFERRTIRVGYSAARAKAGSEILVASRGLRLPEGLDLEERPAA